MFTQRMSSKGTAVNRALHLCLEARGSLELMLPVSEFNEFKPRLKSPKTGLNLEKLNTKK